MNFVKYPLRFHTAGRLEFKRNPSKRFISCEIEVNSLGGSGSYVDKECFRKKHSIVEDGSLESEGFEINTAPAQGDVFVAHIKSLCDTLDEAKASVGINCGYHVHVDARDFNYWDIRRLIKLYAKLEDGLFEVVAKSRRHNANCARCANTYLSGFNKYKGKAKEAFARTLYSTTDHKDLACHKRDKYSCNLRYTALNLHSWFHRGTVECRLHHGTTDASKIINWGILWAGILDFANRNSEASIAALQGTSFEILLQVAPTDGIREYLKKRKAYFDARPFSNSAV